MKLENANKLIEAIASHSPSEKGRLWTKNSTVRIYLRKGFCEMTDTGAVDVGPVGGLAFAQGIAMIAMRAGLSVIDSGKSLDIEKLSKKL